MVRQIHNSLATPTQHTTARIDNLRARGVMITLFDEVPHPDFDTVDNGHVFVTIGESDLDTPDGPLAFRIYDGDDQTTGAMLDIIEYTLADRAFRCQCRPYCECPDRPDFPAQCRGRRLCNGEYDYYLRVPLSVAAGFLDARSPHQRIGWAETFGPEPEAVAVLACWRTGRELEQQAALAEQADDPTAAERFRTAAVEIGSSRALERAVRLARLDMQIEDMREDLRHLEGLRPRLVA